MSIIAKQRYIKVIREISDNQQKYIETEHYLYLYETTLDTTVQTFKLAEVLDISYRKTTEKYGTLYLHTLQGVFTYNVTNDPVYFIEMLKKTIVRW